MEGLAEAIVRDPKPEAVMTHIVRDLLATLDDESIPVSDRVGFAIATLDQVIKAIAALAARCN